MEIRVKFIITLPGLPDIQVSPPIFTAPDPEPRKMQAPKPAARTAYLKGADIPEGCEFSGADILARTQCEGKECLTECPAWLPEPGSNG